MEEELKYALVAYVYFLQGHIMVGQGGMALNRKRVDLD